MEEPKESEDMMERKSRRLYDMMIEYTKRRKRPVDKKRIVEQINMGFLYTDRTYGMFDDTLLTTALNEEIEDAALELAKNGKKANIGHINAEGNYALLLACKKKFKSVITELLKHKGNPCAPNSEGETPLTYAVSDVDMTDVVKLLIDKDLCDGSDYKKEIMRILEVGNFEAFKILLDVPELGLNSYVYGNDSKLTLLEYIFISDLGADYSENHRYAQELLKKTKFGCNPLHINRAHNVSALLFAVGDTGSDINLCIHNIKELLKYAEEEGNTKYVDFKSATGKTAFDLIFHNAYADGGSVDVRILKLFIDYYYKNNPNSKSFLRNIPKMCNEPALFEALKNLYPASVKDLLDSACQDVIAARATLVRPHTPTPEIPVGKRSSSKRSGKKSAEKLEDAEEIPIVNALTPVSPLPLWAQVDDPHEVGVRMPKPYSPRRGGKKTRKTRK